MKIDVWCHVCQKRTLEVDDKFKALLNEEEYNDDLGDELVDIANQMAEDLSTEDEQIYEVYSGFDAETGDCLFEF